MTSSSNDGARWPDIAVPQWTGTKHSLHLYAQMLGKLRVALSPAQPNWMFTALYLTASGFTTGPIPYEGIAFDGTLDVFTSEIILRRSNGKERRIPLLPARPVAAVYADLRAALDQLDLMCDVTPTPQECVDVTPFHEDTRNAEYDPAAVQRWFESMTAVSGVFERWRAHFFGRSGIQLWWGAFDFALILFNGKHATAPADRGYLMKYDLDAELMNVGLYVPEDDQPPFFYGYIYPEPNGAPVFPIRPSEASWSTTYKEWVLPYDAVRNSATPDLLIADFLDAIYEHCVNAAGWDRSALSYVAPPRPS